MRKYFIGFTALLSSMTLLNRAWALDDSTRSAARALVNEGVANYEAGRYEEARRRFMAAYDTAKVPTVAVWAARAHERLGKLVTASELFESALLMEPNDLWVGTAQQQAQGEAREALEQLRPRVPRLQIVLSDFDDCTPEVVIDDVKVATSLLATERPLDPGSHAVSVTCGSDSRSETVTLVEMGHSVLDIKHANRLLPQRVAAAVETTAHPSASSKAPTKPLRIAGWASVGLGVAGVAVGATGGLVLAIKRSNLHDAGCSGNVCDGASYQSRVDSYNAWRNVSSVGFIVGGAGAALGLTLLIVSGTDQSPQQVGLVFAPDAIAARGTF